jgi:hypothetical protein
MRRSFQLNGARSLYRGLSVPLVFTSLVTAVEMSSWGLGKRIIYTVSLQDQDTPLALWQVQLAGTASAFLSSLVYTPVELVRRFLCSLISVQVKVRLQSSQREHRYRGPVDCLKQVIRTSGLRGLWQGNTATLARELPAASFYYGSFRSSSSTHINRHIRIRQAHACRSQRRRVHSFNRADFRRVCRNGKLDRCNAWRYDQIAYSNW